MAPIDPRAIERVKGPAWDGIRHQFETVARTLLDAAPDTASELTTIYVKFRVTADGPVYAVVWLRRASELVVGLAVPQDAGGKLSAPPKGREYPKLRGYFVVPAGGTVPRELAAWANAAYAAVRVSACLQSSQS